MTGKVFGIGLNKTGTTTLGVCLRTLGFRHAPYAGRFVPDVKAGRFQDLFAYAEGYDSFEDWPWPLAYRELEARFPGSRFILTTRKDADTWFDSLRGHSERTGPTPERELVYGHAMPHGHRADHRRIYEEHNRAALAHFDGRPESFLHVCWETGSGWPQLCAFLGVDVPKEPFPHAHRAPSRETPREKPGTAG